MTRNPPVGKDYIGNEMTPFTESNNDDTGSVVAFLSLTTFLRFAHSFL